MSNLSNLDSEIIWSGIGGVILGIICPLISKILFKSFNYIKLLYIYATRKKIVIVGPENAGKSTLFDYLSFKEISLEQAPTLEPKTRRMVKFKNLKIKKKDLIGQLSDYPGHNGPINHANFVFKQRANIFIIVLNSEQRVRQGNLSNKKWLEIFWEQLEELCKYKCLLRRRRYITFLILYNKVDKIEEKEIDKDIKDLKIIVKNNKKLWHGIKLDRNEFIKPSCLISHKLHEELIDSIVNDLSKSIGVL